MTFAFDRKWLAFLALAAVAYCGLFAANSLVRIRTFTADSMNYVDVARRAAAGDGLVQSTGGFNQPFYLSGDLDLPSAFTVQPPAYPLAIAFASRFGLDAADAALVVSALAYAAILVLVYLLGQRIGSSLQAGAGRRPVTECAGIRKNGPRSGDHAAAAVSLGVAILFVPLTLLGRSALSEVMAVAVVLLFFLLLDRTLGRLNEKASAVLPGGSGRLRRPAWLGRLPLLGLGALAGSAFCVRYALWPLPLVGIAAIWLGRAARSRTGAGTSEAQGYSSAWKRRGLPGVHSGGSGRSAWLDAAAFTAGALVPIGAVLARNLLVEGRLLPLAMPAVRSLGENLSLAITALLGGWRSTTVGNLSDAVLLVVAMAILLAFAVRNRSSWIRQDQAQGSTRGGPPRWRLPLLIGLWSVLYLAAVVWRSSQANLDPIGVRLALPVTVPLIPVFGALLAAALPRARRFAWLPVPILALCAGAAFAREASLWSSGHDARSVEFRNERQQWLRDHTGPADLVIGGGAMDVPFLFPGRFAISYAGLPYTEVLTWPALERIADRHCPHFDRLLLVVRPTVQLGGARSDEDPSDWLGPFIADARAGRVESYPLLEPLAVLSEARIYRIACPY